MRTAYNRTRTFRGDSGGMYEGSAVGELDQGLLARLGANCSDFSPIDRIAHVTAIAGVITRRRELAASTDDRGRRRTLGQVHAPAASEGDDSK